MKKTLPAFVVESINGRTRRVGYVENQESLWRFMRGSEHRDIALRVDRAYDALESGGSYTYGSTTYEIEEN